MPEIPSVTSVVVTADYRSTGGVPLYGIVTFTPSTLGIADDAVIIPSTVEVRVVNGQLAVALAVSDDPDLAPSGMTYSVTEDFGLGLGQYEITLTADMAPTVELNEIAPWPRPPISDPPPPAAVYVGSVNGRTGAVTLTKADVGLAAVDNTSDAAKPVSTAVQAALDGKQAVLPSGTASQFLRGSDKTFVSVTKSDVGLGSVDNTSDAAKPVSTATQTALGGKQNALPAGTSSQFLRGSDHTFVSISKTSVGLDQVDNVADVNKPISTATQAALNAKQGTLPSGTASQFLRGSDKTFVAVAKSDVGLGSVDNTSDAAKPVSTATQTALNGKLSLGGGTLTAAVTTTAGGQAGTGTQPLTTVAYVQSREENLISNGSGLLGNNYNFSSFTFDPTVTFAGGGSFRNATFSAVATNDELIPVVPTNTYRLSVHAISSAYVAGAKALLGIAPYDIDGLGIAPQNYMKYPGSTDTTLAAQLNPGDTTMQLTNATGWYNSTLNSTNSQFIWYGYANAKGYTYPNHTYTRRSSVTYKAGGWWASGGISSNVITLNGAWSGPVIPAGTAVRNSTGGGTYKYIAGTNVEIPATWTSYSGYIGGYDTAATGGTNVFPYGTAYVRIVFLLNRDVAGNTTNVGPVSFTSNATTSAILLRSPNGTAYQITVDNSGVLAATAL